MSPKSGRSKPALDYEVCPLSPTRERVRVREIESDAHKALKAHVENHPDLVGLDSSATSEQEYYFRTPLGERIGDHVDVIFWGGGVDSTVVEVELEGEGYVLVGVHQAIKYRALAAAELSLPNVGPSTRVRAFVVGLRDRLSGSAGRCRSLRDRTSQNPCGPSSAA